MGPGADFEWFTVAISYRGHESELRTILKYLDLVQRMPVVTERFVRKDTESDYLPLTGGAVFSNPRKRTLKPTYRQGPMHLALLAPTLPCALEVDVYGHKV